MSADNFDFIRRMEQTAAELEIDDRPKVDLKFWELSSGFRIYSKGVGQSRPTAMCKRCGAVVGDYQQHAQWHIGVENIDVGIVSKSTTY